jgi:hypothetical protein
MASVSCQLGRTRTPQAAADSAAAARVDHGEDGTTIRVGILKPESNAFGTMIIPALEEISATEPLSFLS